MSGRLNPPDVIAAADPPTSSSARRASTPTATASTPPRSACEARARGELDPPHGYTAEQISAALNNTDRTGRISLGDIYALARAPGPGVAEARH